MALSHTNIGPFHLYTVETGRIRLDGGAMFGVVPKPLWSRKIPSDDRNRISMAMRCLLIHSKNTGRLYLVDNGAGNKFNDKERDIYGLDYDHSHLHRSLEAHGFSAADVTDMVFTHLHFDHCGWTTFYDDNQRLRLTFPNATHHVTENHWENVRNPNLRERVNFDPENIELMGTQNQLELRKEEQSYEEGLDFLRVDGHTIGQQLPLIRTDDTTLLYAADLIPTHAHVHIPWVMGYDNYPVSTLEEKQQILKQAVENGWYLYLQHDADHEMITVRYNQEKKKYEPAEFLTLDDL